MFTKSLDQHIETTPEVVGGKPRLTGHRITVQDIVIWHEWMGRRADDIAAEYDLTLSQVYAALAYYYDHQQEIDTTLQASQEFIETLRQRTPSPVWQKLHEQPHQILHR
jgi:uncharacterized protein (DUF433 family)